MSELRLSEPLARDPLLHAIAADLHLWVPGFRQLAQGLLAEESRIDLFGVDEAGAAVLVSVGASDEALARLARLLAQRRWLEPRLDDWRKLAPDLGIRSDLPILGVLACPEFGKEATAAAQALGAPWLRLVRYHSVRNGSGIGLLLEPLGSPGAPVTSPSEPQQRAAVAGPARFRTGLSDSDLELSDAERAEFE